MQKCENYPDLSSYKTCIDRYCESKTNVFRRSYFFGSVTQKPASDEGSGLNQETGKYSWIKLPG